MMDEVSGISGSLLVGGGVSSSQGVTSLVWRPGYDPLEDENTSAAEARIIVLGRLHMKLGAALKDQELAFASCLADPGLGVQGGR